MNEKFSKLGFYPSDILLPKNVDMSKWAVVACDQFTSEPEYWERVDKYVGDAPSTLRLILPESKLESDNVDQEIQKINHTMEQYLADGRLQELEDAMLLLERKLSNGKTRLGLLGKLDLDQYSYEKGSGTPIRATEGTVLSRIPPRMKVRRNAPIELPHIMVLIDDPQKEIIEPLRDLFKDEVRKAGLELGIPDYLVFRQPFPGPGLGIRIIGDVTAEKVQMVQDADAIWREEIAKAGLDKEVNQYFAALTNMRSVGVMGDERTYDYAIALRAVTTTDFMTAESAEIPWDVIGRTTSRIVNEVKHVNRVMYDCTGKPPATIEFE